MVVASTTKCFRYYTRRMQKAARMKKELAMLESSPPPGASCWTVQDKLDQLEAAIIGPDGTPYQAGRPHIET